jgi:RNA polymerase sigma factor for flagellar operon FliA
LYDKIVDMNSLTDASPDLDLFEEGDLWRAILSRNCDDAQSARHTIILRYQFLIKAAARKLKSTLPSYVLEEDLMSYGQIGLIKAVDTYEPERGAFRGFAYLKIYGAILDELRTQDWAPRGLRREQRMIAEAKREMQVENPTNEALSDQLGWDETKLTATIKKIENSQHRNLDGMEDHLSDHEPEVLTNAEVLCNIFADTLESLPAEHRLILVRRYFLNQTLSVVAEETQTPLTVVRRVHSEALLKVLDAMTNAVR